LLGSSEDESTKKENVAGWNFWVGLFAPLMSPSSRMGITKEHPFQAVFFLVYSSSLSSKT
jgi:hypothetical protein